MADYLPASDTGLLSFATDFSSVLTPGPTVFGLTTVQMTSYNAALATYSAALTAATSGATRGVSTVFAKDTARKNLVALTRQYVGIIQKCPIVTDQQRVDLNITVPDQHRTPQPPPDATPVVEVQTVEQNVVTITLHADGATRRKLPPRAIGAAIFSFVGPNPPADPSEYKFEGNTTRTKLNVVFDPSLAPGTKVWIAAFYFSRRTLSGPISSPTSAIIQFALQAQPASTTQALAA